MPHPKVKIADNDGNTVAIDTSGASNALKVSLLATPTIDIGDVSLLLGGTAASTNADTMDDQTLRVTLATDDTHWGTVGTASDVDGTAHGQLRYIGNALASQSTIASNTGGAKDVLNWAVSTTGGQYAEGDGGFLATGVRNDTLASLVSVDHDHAPFQVNALGALYTTGGEVENEPVQSEPLLIGGRYDSSARTLNAGDAGAIALSASGHVLTAISDGTEVANVTSNNELEVSLNNIDGAAGTMIVKQAIIPTATNTKASVGTGSTEITAAVPTRYSIDIVNDSDEVVYLGLEDAAVLNEGIRLNPNGGSYSSNTFTGAIYGIAAATANVTAAWTH